MSLLFQGQERGGVEPLSISPAAPDKGTALMEAIDMTAAGVFIYNLVYMYNVYMH